MANVEGFMINRFTLQNQGELVNSNRGSGYSDEQVLSWAFEELDTAARTGVGLGSWPSRKEGVQERALEAIEGTLDLANWAVVQDRDFGSLDRSALGAVTALVEFGTEPQRQKGLGVLEQNRDLIGAREHAYHRDFLKYRPFNGSYQRILRVLNSQPSLVPTR